MEIWMEAMHLDFVPASTRIPFATPTEDVCNLYQAWHSRNSLPTMIHGETVCNIAPTPQSQVNRAVFSQAATWSMMNIWATIINLIGHQNFVQMGYKIVALVSVLLRSFVLSIRSIVVRRTRGRFILISIEKKKNRHVQLVSLYPW
jgi:hypothetical protein